jgi:hypothetical protein
MQDTLASTAERRLQRPGCLRLTASSSNNCRLGTGSALPALNKLSMLNPI